MVRNLSLLLVLIFLSSCVAPQTDVVHRELEDFHCQIDQDCLAIVTQCGECVDNDLAINRNYLKKYSDQYLALCQDNARTCEIEPLGAAECQNNKCVLVK